jgi:hypothetical protein
MINLVNFPASQQARSDFMDASNPSASAKPPENAQSLRLVEEALRGLRYGTVTVVVQDGVIVQVERTERKRLTSPGRRP